MKIKSYATQISLLLTLFLYQNCAGNFSSESTVTQQIETPSTVPALDETNTGVVNNNDPAPLADNVAPVNPTPDSTEQDIPIEPVLEPTTPVIVGSQGQMYACSKKATPSNLQQIINSTISGVICLQKGTYNDVLIDGKLKTTKDKPFILTPEPGAEELVIFKGESFERKTMIRVFNSKNVTINGFYFTRAQKAILFASVEGGLISNNTIKDIGMEAIHIGKFYGGEPRGDKPSSFIKISKNIIDGTGRRLTDKGEPNRYGEGIYIGNGSNPELDKTHDIEISDNIIKKTTAEAIELKPFTYNIKVLNNVISDINLIFSGAITVGVGPKTKIGDSNHLIQGNTISNVTSRGFSIGGIVVAAGRTRVFDNKITNIEGGRSIRIYKSMKNTNEKYNTVELRGNDVNKIEVNQANGTYAGRNAKVIYLD